MGDTIYRDVAITETEHEFKYVATGKESLPRNTSSIVGAGDFVRKPERSPTDVPRAPPRTKRTRTRSAPPARPIPPCREDDKEPTMKLQKRPPYNPLLNPFKDDMEEEELVEYKGEKSSLISFSSIQGRKESAVIKYEKSIHSLAGHNDGKKMKISVSEYPESLNPFAGDTDEDEDKKADYDESHNPFAPPPRPPPPVFKKKTPQPTAPVPPPVASTSFRKTLSQIFFKQNDKKEARTLEKDMKWICIKPVKKAVFGHLCLKKGQKVKQTGPANTDGFAYGYTKKGILRTKVWGYFPLANMHLLEDK